MHGLKKKFWTLLKMITAYFKCMTTNKKFTFFKKKHTQFNLTTVLV